MNVHTLFKWLPVLCLLPACQPAADKADAYGNFESTEVIVSAQGNGPIDSLAVEEGDSLSAGQLVGYVDTTQLYLKKLQLQSSIRALQSKMPDVFTQVNDIREQIEVQKAEEQRYEKLVQGQAAPQKQLDDIRHQIAILQKELQARESQLNTSSRGLLAEVQPLQDQVSQVEDQIMRSRIINPIRGEVLVKYAEPHEVAQYGKPLYKIADLSSMILRCYISGSQLSDVRIGMQVNVKIDSGEQDYRTYQGIIEWVAAEAEFTPKVVQTKEERTDLVYAVKVRVKNDGFIKIGMPGEMILPADSLQSKNQ